MKRRRRRSSAQWSAVLLERSRSCPAGERNGLCCKSFHPFSVHSATQLYYTNYLHKVIKIHLAVNLGVWYVSQQPAWSSSDHHVGLHLVVTWGGEKKRNVNKLLRTSTRDLSSVTYAILSQPREPVLLQATLPVLDSPLLNLDIYLFLLPIIFHMQLLPSNSLPSSMFRRL
ncbi:hypothetical protein SRHO_G00101810 [Serrasalmus rhombeus]